jgi:hypothetical protein
MTDAVEIGVGRYHVCMRKADGSVWCRGHNGFGQVGIDPPSEGEPLSQVAGVLASVGVMPLLEGDTTRL